MKREYSYEEINKLINETPLWKHYLKAILYSYGCKKPEVVIKEVERLQKRNKK